MAGIDAALWREISPLLDDLIEREPHEQRERLAALRARDAALADAVESLMAHGAAVDRGGFLCDAPEWQSEEASLVGQRVGAYRIVRAIGRGGMGTVWLGARDDGRFEGHAAIKFLNLALIGDRGGERFAREGRILGRLAHPNIARLLDAGVMAGGQPYLVLEYVEGEPLDRHCDARALDTTSRIEAFLQVLDAVSHAHRNLVLHRDLKPSNILVDAEGRIKLLDFGVAKLLQEGESTAGTTELTQFAGRAFTPEYAAPEQIQGGDVTTATDVYALGVLLYVLLAGQHPTAYDVAAPVERLHAVIDRLPPRLSVAAQHTSSEAAKRRSSTPDALAHRLRGDLENIAARALRKDPAERYASVDALAEDLRHYLRDEPVSARADTLRYRAGKFVQRHRMPVALAALALVALIAGVAGTITQARRATAQAAVAEAQRARADREAHVAATQRDFALRQLSRVDAVNDLNTFLLSDAVPAGKPLTVGQLLARAEELVERQPGDADANRIAMLVAIGQQYKFLDRDDKAREVLGRAYEASQRTSDASVRAQAACAYAEAVAAGTDTARAEAILRDALAELPQEPQFDLDRMACYWRGSALAAMADNEADAIRRAEIARDIYERLPYPSRTWDLHIMIALGEAYRVAGRNEDAIAAFEDADESLRALGRENTEDASTLYNNWGLALESSGRPLDAEHLYRRAIDNSGAAGRDKDVSPMLENNYARTLARLGVLHDAATWADRAYEGARRAGDEIVRNQALLVRIAICRDLGRLDVAQTLFTEAQRRFTRMYPPRHRAMAALASQRALLAEARGDTQAALQAFDEAIAIARADGQENPDFLRRRAETELHMNRIDAARADAAAAIAIRERRVTAGHPSSYLGLAYLTLGRALRAAGDSHAAHDAFAFAAAQLHPTAGADNPDTRAAEQAATETAPGPAS
ncbi:MAG TPA: protein kinase [Casimicrobiaceae bacterium]